MKNIPLNEELLNQLRLIKYDRSKTLLEQTLKNDLSITLGEQGFGGSSGLIGGGEYIPKRKYGNPRDKDDFFAVYPNYCKYPKKAGVPEEGGKEFIPWDEKNSYGYCNYGDGRNSSIMLPFDAEITFTTKKIQRNLIKALLNEFKDIKYKNFLMNNFRYRLYIDNEEYKNNPKNATDTALLNFITESVEKSFPIDSIIKFKLINNREYTGILKTGLNGLFNFLYYYGSDGKIYNGPSITDRRTKYQKFIDEWGTIVQISVLIATSIATAGATGIVATLAELGIELTTSTILALRDFEKGDNIMGIANILSGGFSGLKLIPRFRGVNINTLKEAGIELKESGLSISSTEDEYIKFITKLNEEKPEVALTIRKALTMDDLSRDILAKEINKEVRLTLKNVIEENPDIINKISFWKKLWVRDVGAQLGVIGVGVLLEFTPLAKKWNDQTKQQYEWILTKIPKEHNPTFIVNTLRNDVLQSPEIINSLYKLCEGISDKVNEKYVSELVASYQNEILQKEGKTFNTEGEDITLIPMEIDVQKSEDDLLKEGYINLNDVQNFNDIDTQVEWVISTDNKTYVKLLKEESTIKNDETEIPK